MAFDVTAGVSDGLVEKACEVMHDAYEQAAIGTGWETQRASRKPWADVPEANKATMRSAIRALLAWLPGDKDGVSDEAVEAGAEAYWDFNRDAEHYPDAEETWSVLVAKDLDGAQVYRDAARSVLEGAKPFS